MSSDGVDREEAKKLLEKIRGTDKKIDFEDKVGNGWIKHSSDSLWRCRMSFGHVATLFEEELIDEMVAEATTLSIRSVDSETE